MCRNIVPCDSTRKWLPSVSLCQGLLVNLYLERYEYPNTMCLEIKHSFIKHEDNVCYSLSYTIAMWLLNL